MEHFCICAWFLCAQILLYLLQSPAVSPLLGRNSEAAMSHHSKKNLRSLASCGYTLQPSSASNNSVSGTFVVSKTVRAWEGVTWLATAGGARTPIPYVAGRNRQGQVRLVISDYTL